MKCYLDSITVNYEVFGSGTPILFIHGFSCDSRLMIGCMEPIFTKRDGYKRIYLDLPGMGKTNGSKTINSSDDMLRIVIDFIDTIISDQSFLLVGESYGGYLSRGVIAKRKEKVDGVAFICPMIVPEMEKRSLPEHFVVVEDKEFIIQLSEDEKTDFRSNNVVLDKNTWIRYKNEVVSGCSIADQRFLSKIKKSYGFTFDVDTITFESPSIFLLGLQDSIVGYKDAFKILENFPRATFSVLDKAGHNLQIEQEVLFNTLINEWLDRLLEVKG
ncbi:alpha/beta hydrolase [Bacillus sp. RG28]|uniref:Alpha/beta hydrolase n=1 Tax=Gottfriedia endophytica TaxID=2820819 RepID=A0A940SJU3_9BACI|nr:alpha/beta hydrolase [Gottfriedia endophytica]MBP0725821.1 alpha/beta hydrolase [Gottfriedia endophytica]